MPHGPGISGILGSPLQHYLYCLSLHSDLQGPLASDVMLPHSLTSVAFWNLGTSFHDLLPLKYFMPTKPVPGGWCCQILLPVWGVAWPPWTTAVSDSVGWSLWERGKVSWQWAGNPSSCTLLSDTLNFLEFEPSGHIFLFFQCQAGTVSVAILVTFQLLPRMYLLASLDSFSSWQTTHLKISLCSNC